MTGIKLRETDVTRIVKLKKAGFAVILQELNLNAQNAEMGT